MSAQSSDATIDPGAGRRWRSTAPQELLYSEWNGEFAIFHRPSGTTHFLNEGGARLLREILNSPKTILNAARELAACADDEECDPEFVTQVGQTIGRFEQLGLIEAE